MYQVTKRDGKTVPFELDKIAKAIEKAFQAQTFSSDAENPSWM